MYSKTVVCGNLGGDPEARYLPSGEMVTNFSVATSEKWTGKDGTPQERVTWFRVSVFGKAAEACNGYLKKGSRVLVDGTLNPDPKTGNPRIFQKNDGTYGASYELRAGTVKFLSSKGESSNGRPAVTEPEEDSIDMPF